MNNCITTNDKLHEMEQFLERQNISRLNHKSIFKNWNKLIASKKLNQQTESPDQKKGPGVFVGEFYQTLKEQISIFLKFSKN